VLFRSFLKRFDADGDGKVSRDEFRQFVKDRLANRDGDADDQIVEAELEPTKPGRGILK
jgi:Ca2+-binding EF-hand superfamily protein